MHDIISHEVGLYVALLLITCAVGIITRSLAHLPYTIALTIVGLGIGLFRFGPNIAETGFSKDLIFFVMLPPLLFVGSLNLDLDRLLSNFWPIAIFAVVGVLVSTVVMGGMLYWLGGLFSFPVALLFGAMMSPTDPVSVLAIFRSMKVPEHLRYLVEGESLFNDGTGVVLYTIILDMALGQTRFHFLDAVQDFVVVVAGGLLMGAVLGILVFFVLRRIDDYLLENTICLVLAYGSFWVAESLHVSGVIAVVTAGLMIGNYGRRFSMSSKTRETIDTFFESIDFIINSLLFIMIGLELQSLGVNDLFDNMGLLAIAVAAMLIARAVAIYPLYLMTNLVGRIRPTGWAHVLFWGGLRGSIPVALLLGLPRSPALEPYRTSILVAGFGVVFFSLVVQGLTMKPLLWALNIADPMSAREGSDSSSGEGKSHR